MKRLAVIASLAAAAALSLRCASAPPPPEIAQARLAIEDAKSAGADRAASREYDAALAHYNVAQTAWTKKKSAAAAAHWARLAEGEARNAQYRSETLSLEEALRRETERRSHGELAVRDAEIALLQARARTDAERRAADSDIRAAQERRQAQEELLRRESAARESERLRYEADARLAAEQGRTEQENSQRSQQERERLKAELEKTRADLESSRRSADDAKRAAEEEQRRLAEQRLANDARAAELQKAREGQQQSEEALRKSLAQLAQVRSEARGLIVTLPGSIYFEVNRSDVKPAMRDRLIEIGRALAAVPGRRLLHRGAHRLRRFRQPQPEALAAASGVGPFRSGGRRRRPGTHRDARVRKDPPGGIQRQGVRQSAEPARRDRSPGGALVVVAASTAPTRA